MAIKNSTRPIINDHKILLKTIDKLLIGLPKNVSITSLSYLISLIENKETEHDIIDAQTIDGATVLLNK